MAALSSVLAQIRQNESGGNYGITPQQNYDYPRSHASGAYQFQPDTWRSWTQQSGIGTQYNEAYQAPPNVQDAVAAYAATRGPGINSRALWGASAGSGYPAVTNIDVTPEQLAAAGSSGVSPGSQVGYGNPTADPSDPFQHFDPTDPNSIQMEPGLGSLPGTQGPTPANPVTGVPGNPGNDPLNPASWPNGGVTSPSTNPGDPFQAFTGAGMPLDIGAQPGLVAAITSWLQNYIVNPLTGAVSGTLASVGSWVTRFFLLFVGAVILIVALWRIAAPDVTPATVAKAVL